MAPPDSKTRPQFSQPFQQLLFMIVASGLAAAGAFLALPFVLPVFLANLWLNIVIAFVFAVGVLSCFWQVFQLMFSVRWIESFATGESENQNHPPRLLAPLATLLRSRGARMILTTMPASAAPPGPLASRRSSRRPRTTATASDPVR